MSNYIENGIIYRDYTKTKIIGYTEDMSNVVVIPNSVTIIGDWAFNSCKSLTSISISDSVISVGEDASLDCTGLISINVSNKNTVYDSRKNCNAIIETATNTLIAGCKNTVIPDDVTNIGQNAFEYCKGLTSISIPDSVKSIGDDAFFGCTGLISINVSPKNTVYDSRNNCNAIIETATNNLIVGCKNTIIPNNVASIGNWAFAGCTGLTDINISNNVINIGRNTFDYCIDLVKKKGFLKARARTFWFKTVRKIK